MIINYLAEITTLGPVHIGSGQEIKKSEYIFDRQLNRIYVMDPKKMFKGLSSLRMLDDFERFVFRQFDSVPVYRDANRSGNKQRDKVLFDFIKEKNIRPEIYKPWAAYSYKLEDSGDLFKRNNNIVAMVKDPYGLPYVPGSSFKGALVNILLGQKLMSNEDEELRNRVTSEVSGEVRSKTKYLQGSSEKCLVNGFHVLRSDKKPIYDAVNSTLRGLIIGDSKPLSVDDIILCQKVDVHKDGSEKKMPLLRECIKPGTVIEIPIEIDTDVFHYDINEIIAAITASYNNLELKFLRSFPGTSEPRRSDDNLLYLGGGTGFVQKTLVYSLYKNRDEAVKTSAKILNAVFYRPNNKNAKASYHLRDFEEHRVSPRVRKCTLYNGKRYDFGLCKVSFKPMP